MKYNSNVNVILGVEEGPLKSILLIRVLYNVNIRYAYSELKMNNACIHIDKLKMSGSLVVYIYAGDDFSMKIVYIVQCTKL
jgi:hypothetical protein